MDRICKNLPLALRHIQTHNLLQQQQSFLSSNYRFHSTLLTLNRIVSKSPSELSINLKPIPTLKHYNFLNNTNYVQSRFLRRNYQKLSVADEDGVESTKTTTSGDKLEETDEMIQDQDSGPVTAAAVGEQELAAQIDQFIKEHQVFVKGSQQQPIFDFNSIELPEKLCQLMSQFGYTKPTPIQAQSLPILFSEQDLIGIAQTGSGKTLAYLLPAFKKYFSVHRDYFSENKNELRLNPKVLVLAPTRELALQIQDVVRQFRIFKSICLYGGSDRNRQVNFLQNNNPLIVVSTPGRLKDLVDAEFLTLKDIEYLVVDEADRMLDMGFEPQIAYLIRQCPKERHSMMFSASWPEEVKSLVFNYLKKDHSLLSIGGNKLVANHNIDQNVSICQFNEKSEELDKILKQHQDDRMIIFANTKISCNRLSQTLRSKYRIRAAPLHGDMSQRQREQTVKDFKDDRFKVLCATNVAARGLDIDNVNVVINYEFPDEIETYVHRIGRTGRKDNKGFAYSFFTDHSNSSLARQLIAILEESKNPVPDQLRLISQYNLKSSKNNRNRYNKNNNSFYTSNNYETNRGGSRGGGSGGGYNSGNNRRNNNYDDLDDYEGDFNPNSSRNYSNNSRNNFRNSGGGRNSYSGGSGNNSRRNENQYNKYDEDYDY